MEKYDEVKEILKKNNQEQLLVCYDKLNAEGKEKLLDQILNVDFELIKDLYEKTKKGVEMGDDIIEPIEYVDKSKLSKEEYENYEKLGDKIIKEGKLAVLTMAGGQGTRLGHSGPKGTYDIGLDSHKSLFELLCDYLKEEGKIDYIHGEDVVRKNLSETAVGFLFDTMSKDELFPTVIKDGALPRKTFSMGHAEDKRYYLEARKIK